MLRIQGSKIGSGPSRRITAGGIVMAFAVQAAGCSTDFRRLEQPSLGLNETSTPRPVEPIGRRNAGAPMDGGSTTWSNSGARAPLPPPAFENQRVASLPASTPNTAGVSKPFDRPKAASPAAPPAGQAPVLGNGPTVDVQPGDTLSAIAKRSNVSIAALMDANQLKSPNLKPGQKLILPASTAKRPLAKTEQRVASAAAVLPSAAAPTRIAAPVVAAAPTDWTGAYTVKPGDSLFAVARAYKIQPAALQAANGIADPTKVRPGTILKVPGGDTPAETSRLAAAPAPAAVAPTQVALVRAPVAAAPVVATPTTTVGFPAPKIINAQPAAPVAPAFDEPAAAPVDAAPSLPVAPPVSPPVAAAPVEKPVVKVNAPAAGAAAVTSSSKFRWPAKGKIVAGFGKRPDGTHNDGINIAVPAGTDIAAAQDGEVAYAGSELKGYGNLILVRHDGGWVTAYAHADQILVKRGDAVKRGQTIAKSGQTGTVDTPQVHFELRQASKPIDPTPHMDK